MLRMAVHLLILLRMHLRMLLWGVLVLPVVVHHMLLWYNTVNEKL